MRRPTFTRIKFVLPKENSIPTRIEGRMTILLIVVAFAIAYAIFQSVRAKTKEREEEKLRIAKRQLELETKESEWQKLLQYCVEPNHPSPDEWPRTLEDNKNFTAIQEEEIWNDKHKDRPIDWVGFVRDVYPKAPRVELEILVPCRPRYALAHPDESSFRFLIEFYKVVAGLDSLDPSIRMSISKGTAVKITGKLVGFARGSSYPNEPTYSVNGTHIELVEALVAPPLEEVQAGYAYSFSYISIIAELWPGKDGRQLMRNQ